MTRAETLAFALIAPAVMAVYVSAGAAPGSRFGPYLFAHGLLLVSSGLLCALGTTEQPTPALTRSAVRRVLALGLVLRVALIPVAPFTTTDVQRYLWDGAVLLSGHDPYALVPLDPQLRSLRAFVALPADHLDVATCYPPLALALFAAAAVFGARALLVWKILCALASALTAAVLARACVDHGRARFVPLAVLGPIAVLETGVGAHLEGFVALTVALMIDASLRARWDRAAFAAGTLAALKLLPGVLALPVLFAAPRPLRFALLATLPLTATFGVAEALGLTAPGSLPMVAENWSFGSPVWAALYARFPTDDALIRPGMAVAGLLAVLWVSLRRRHLAADTAAAAGWNLAASPVLYPWYGASLAALAPLAPRWWSLALLAALPTSYEVLDGYQEHHRWSPSAWPMALLAVATLAGLAADLLARRRAR